MRKVTLGPTGITVVQNAFGALPIQRIPQDDAVTLLRRAYEGGMRLFDTARMYSDSEAKVGVTFEGMRDEVIIATKTQATNPETFWKDLETSLRNLRTDHIDIYQLHNVAQCYSPDDGTGIYECLLEARERGMVEHIGITTHRIGVAFDIVVSGLYETLQFPFSYLSTDREIELVERCGQAGMGFIAMKGLAGGLITRSDAAMAHMARYDNVLPIWGIQKQAELEEWLSYMEKTPVWTDEIAAFVEQERNALSGDFCRGCGYCKPCPVDISINDCARMSLMLRRAPSGDWLTPHWQTEMAKIEDCIDCRQCAERCPYGLDTPELLRRNYQDYQDVLAGRTQV